MVKWVRQYFLSGRSFPYAFGLLGSLAVLLLPQISLARWATLSDAGIDILEFKTVTHVSRLGDTTETSDYKIKILKETAKANFSPYVHPYNFTTTKIEIKDAKTVLNGTGYPVHSSQIVQALRSQNSVHTDFDQMGIYKVGFPNLSIDAIVSFQLVSRNKPIFSGYFSKFIQFDNYRFGSVAQVSSEVHEIYSEIPLYFATHDPNSLVDVQQFNSHSATYPYFYVVKSNRPFLNFFQDEDHSARLLTDHSSVRFSSFPEGDWEKIGSYYHSHFKPVLEEDLPPELERIKSESANLLTFHQKVDQVTSQLALLIPEVSITYLNGLDLPRGLAKILSTHTASKSEFAALLVSILQKMGITSYITLINKYFSYLVEPPLMQLPHTDFPHTLVQIVDENGDIHWVDPSFPVSYSQGLVDDVLAEKTALVLNPSKFYLTRLPALHSQDSRERTEFKIHFDHDGQPYSQVSTLKQGLKAVRLHDSLKKKSEEQMINSLFEETAGQTLSDLLFRKVNEAPSISQVESRIVNDVFFSGNYVSQKNVMRTTEGWMFFSEAKSGPQALLGLFHSIGRDRVSDLDLERSPSDTQVVTEFSKLGRWVPLVDPSLRGCKLENDYFSASRIYQETLESFKIMDQLVIKKWHIPLKVLQSAEGSAFINEFIDCFQPIGISLQKRQTNHEGA